MSIEQDCTSAKPQRMCVICRRRFPKHELQRYVLSNQHILTKDEKQNSPGRGWYVCSDPHCERKFSKFRAGSQARRG